MNRLEKLAEIEGMSVELLIREATFDSVVPGICDKCDETARLEPDGTCGCPCGGTIRSCLLIAGMI